MCIFKILCFRQTQQAQTLSFSFLSSKGFTLKQPLSSLEFECLPYLVPGDLLEIEPATKMPGRLCGELLSELT